MRCVVQRVSDAYVTSEGEETGRIGRGLMVLIGVSCEDTERDVKYMAEKVPNLRIFEDEAGKTNRSLADVDGQVLVVSQFTLYADCKHGNRPSFTSAGAPDTARTLYERFCEMVRTDMGEVQTGEFGADMQVSLVNSGPFTIWLDTDQL